MGKGELYVAFAKLKARLEEEGLFDPARKKELPAFPARVALVTSPTGAAVRDVIRVATKIHAGVEIIVYPVRVQGEGAGVEIAEGIGFLNSVGGFDVIILARGGGSIEDLWAFNEEVVARAVAASRIPVVSAVGHEIDFTIADFVADARAPTPSAAPSLVLADYLDAVGRLESLIEKGGSAVKGRIERHSAFLDNLRTHYGMRAVGDRVTTGMRDLDEALARARTTLESRVSEARAYLAGQVGKAQALSPVATLERGYSIVSLKESGEIVKAVGQVAPGDRLRIRFSRGSAEAGVEKTEEEQ
jgi:exodeoxyribonuclease VII large subunit